MPSEIIAIMEIEMPHGAGSILRAFVIACVNERLSSPLCSALLIIQTQATIATPLMQS